MKKYHSKINRYPNHLRSNKEVTMPQSKWRYKNPIYSRLLTYTSTLKVTPPSSIVHSLQPQQTQHTNLIHTTQQIETTIVNHPPKSFSNINELTGLNILPPRKIPGRIVTPKKTKALENQPLIITNTKANQERNPIKMNGKSKGHQHLEPKQYKRKWFKPK